MKTVEQDSGSETYSASTLSQDPDNAQLVTMEIESCNFLRFQVDTGAQCNVIPVNLYKQASNDHSLQKVTRAMGKIVAYGGSTIPVVGTVLLSVRRGKQSIESAASRAKSDHSLDRKPVLE